MIRIYINEGTSISETSHKTTYNQGNDCFGEFHTSLNKKLFTYEI